MLTIITPIKIRAPRRKVLSEFLKANIPVFKEHHFIVIDSGGGEDFRTLADLYIAGEMTLWQARKFGYALVHTKYIMNLDCDVIVPRGYIEKALEMMEANEKIAAVSIFYNDVTHNGGILEYGVSIWRTEVVKELYDYDPQQISHETIKIGDKYITAGYPYCECMHMWRKVLEKGMKIETLPIRALHLSSNESRDK
jgi:hypothetical protein